MAVSRDTAKRICARAMAAAALSGPAAAWFVGWTEKWLRPWTAGAEYTPRAITTMAANAASHAKVVYDGR